MSPKEKIIQPDGAKNLHGRLQKEGGKVVFTNGCFDLLHPGHLRTLNFAKSCGDVLVVGLNTDASVTKLKGPSRPLLLLEARLELLAALEVVDHVIPFKEDTPLRLVQELEPDVIVKGGDYQPEDVVGLDFVRSRGGEVRIAPLEKGFSTSDLIKQIRKNPA